MAYTNGVQTLVQSMNGLLTFNDGAGTVIGGDTITTGTVTVDVLNVSNFSVNSIIAASTTTVCQLWNNLTAGVAITIGSVNTPLRSAYLAVSGDDLVNYTAMSNFVSNTLLSLSNTWTGGYNTFTQGVTTNSILPQSTGNTTYQFYNTAGVTDTLAIAPLGKFQAGTSTSNTNTHQISRVTFSKDASNNGYVDAAGGVTFSLYIGNGNNNTYIGKGTQATSIQSNLFAKGSTNLNGNAYVASTSGLNGYVSNTGLQGAQMCYNVDGKNEFDIICNTLSTSVKGGLNVYTQYNATVGSTAPVALLSVFQSGIQFRNTGICFDKGNLTAPNSATGFYIQTGTNTFTSNIPANTRRELTVTFTTAFSAAPHITATNAYYNASLTNANKGIVSVGNVTASTFVIMVYNVSSADITVDLPVNWTAIGQY